MTALTNPPNSRAIQAFGLSSLMMQGNPSSEDCLMNSLAQVPGTSILNDQITGNAGMPIAGIGRQKHYERERKVRLRWRSALAMEFRPAQSFSLPC